MSGKLWTWVRAQTGIEKLGLLAAAQLLWALDWVFPLHGVASYALVGTGTVLTLAWLLHIVVVPLRAVAAAPRPLLRMVIRLGALGFVISFLIAKWLLVLEADASDPSYVTGSRSYSLALLLTLLTAHVSVSLRFTHLVNAIAEHPARLMASSFGGTGLVGALLLSMPVSIHDLSRVSLIDNLFMAFSAVCVTGLSVNVVPEAYSLGGQIVLCALIQVGGLGIMVLSAAIAIMAGQRLKIKSSMLLSEMVDSTSLASIRRTLVMICLYTFVLEGIGVALLYPQFSAHPEMALSTGHQLAGAGSAWWAAIFHSISAFCNAGFSNFHAGLSPLAGHPGALSVVAVLVVLGGVGFPVLDELRRAAFQRVKGQRPNRLSLHSRVVLHTSALLLLVMSAAYLVLEWTRVLAPLSPFERLMAAVFQSVSARTAGFNVVDIGSMHAATLVLTCVAMFIGASPGSTGGGIKTTTLATIVAGLRSELTGGAPQLQHRRLPEAVVRKAIGVTALSMCLVSCSVILLLLLEPHPPLAVAFEVISAFSTTGLSTGITPELSSAGKLVITFTMFAGRIGPLTLALAIASKNRAAAVELPEERVLVG